jgi:hypothetical protein
MARDTSEEGDRANVDREPRQRWSEPPVADLAREIRKFFIPDFSDWKNRNNYQRAFERR